LGLSLKDLLPVAGAAAGFFLPGAGSVGAAAMNAALGSGIGTLIAGGDIGDAVKNAAFAGAAGYGLGQIPSAAQAAGIAGAAGTTSQAAAANQAAQAALLQGGSRAGLAEAVALEGAAGGAAGAGAGAAGAGSAAAGQKVAESFGAKVADRFMSPMGLLAGSTLMAAFEEPETIELTPEQRAQMETGERRPDYRGQQVSNLFVDPYTGQAYNTAEERLMAMEESRRKRSRGIEDVVYARDGGYIQGPGTGRSDDVKAGIFQNGQKVQEARLSDGEFVMTERAVRGIGNGDRSKGAAKMYEMMRQYERMA